MDNKKTTNNGHPRKGRECDQCSLCCTYLRIESRPGHSTRLDTSEDLAKPAGVSCRYLGSGGCTIYDVRPAACRQFACDWLIGAKGYGDGDSPLKTGSMGVRGFKFSIGSS